MAEPLEVETIKLNDKPTEDKYQYLFLTSMAFLNIGSKISFLVEFSSVPSCCGDVDVTIRDYYPIPSIIGIIICCFKLFYLWVLNFRTTDAANDLTTTVSTLLYKICSLLNLGFSWRIGQLNVTGLTITAVGVFFSIASARRLQRRKRGCLVLLFGACILGTVILLAISAFNVSGSIWTNSEEPLNDDSGGDLRGMWTSALYLGQCANTGYATNYSTITRHNVPNGMYVKEWCNRTLSDNSTATFDDDQFIQYGYNCCIWRRRKSN